MTIPKGQEHAMKMLMRSSKSQRKPVERFLWGLILSLAIGAAASGFLLVLFWLIGILGISLPERAFYLVNAVVAFVASATIFRVMFRTRLDEKSDFVRKATNIGIERHMAEDFYEEHAGSVVLT